MPPEGPQYCRHNLGAARRLGKYVTEVAVLTRLYFLLRDLCVCVLCANFRTYAGLVLALWTHFVAIYYSRFAHIPSTPLPGNESVRDQDGYSWIQYYSLYIIYEFCLWSCPGTAVLNHQKVFCENSPILASKPGVSWDEAPIFRFGKSPPVILGFLPFFREIRKKETNQKSHEFWWDPKIPQQFATKEKKRENLENPIWNNPFLFPQIWGMVFFQKTQLSHPVSGGIESLGTNPKLLGSNISCPSPMSRVTSGSHSPPWK